MKFRSSYDIKEKFQPKFIANTVANVFLSEAKNEKMA